MSQDQSNIWACKNCHGVFSTQHGKSECPSFPGGGGCDPVWQGSRELLLHASTPGGGQRAWTICRKCKGVFFGAPGAAGRCPMGDAHETTAGIDLMLYEEGSPPPFSGAGNYRWCRNCQSLFLWYPGAATQGTCPAHPGGSGHDGSISGPYVLALAEAAEPIVTRERPVAGRIPFAGPSSPIREAVRPIPTNEWLVEEVRPRPVNPRELEPVIVPNPGPAFAASPAVEGLAADIQERLRHLAEVGPVPYRDYLVAQAGVSRELLAKRYHQDFTTNKTTAEPAVVLAARTLARALVAPAPHGLGKAAVEGEPSSPLAHLDALIQRSGLTALELERRYHVRLRRGADAVSSEVDENIHALQRLLSDDWQAETVGESQSIVPPHDLLLTYVGDRNPRPRQPGGGRFFFYYDEWVEQQQPFFAEACFRMDACVVAKGTVAELLAEGHEALSLGHHALALDRYLALEHELFTNSRLPPNVAKMESRNYDSNSVVQVFVHRIVEAIGPTATAVLQQRRTLPTKALADVRALERYFASTRGSAAEIKDRELVGELHLMACALPVMIGDAALGCGQYAEAVHQYQRALPWTVIAGLFSPEDAEASPLDGTLAFTFAEPAHVRISEPWKRALRDEVDASLVLREALHHPVEERYIRTRLGQAMVEWADELHRQGGEGNTGRARELYKAALLLHHQDPGVTGRWPQRPSRSAPPLSTLEPSARATIARARLGLHRVEEGLDWFGLSHELVPVLRYRTLRNAAQALASSAAAAQSELMHHLESATDLMRERRRQEQLVRHAQLQVQTARIRREQAQVAVDAAKAQVVAVEAAIAAKRKEIEDHEGLGQQFLDFFSGAVGAVTGIVKGGKEAMGLLGASDKAALASGAKGALGMGGQATALGGMSVMAGYGLFVYAGATSMSGLADAANQRQADLRTLRDSTLPAAQAAVQAKLREAALYDLQRQVALDDERVARSLLQLGRLGALGVSVTAELIQLSRRLLRRYLDDGARMAWLAERALGYELGQDVAIIKHDYFPQERQGIGGADLLQADLHALELARIDAMQRQLPVQHTFSLLRDFPLAFGMLRRHGRCRVHTTEHALRAAYPGTFGHRIVAAQAVPVASNALSPIRGMLHNDGLSRVSDADGTLRPSVRPADALPISEHGGARAVAVELAAESLASFEGSGVDTFWEIELPAAGNPQGLDTLGDVLLTLETRARYSPELQAPTRPPSQPAIVMSLARALDDAARQKLRAGEAVVLTVDPSMLLGFGGTLVGVAVLLVGSNVSGPRSAELRRAGGAVPFELRDGVAFAHTTLGATGALGAALGQPPGSIQAVALAAGTGAIEDVVLVLERSA